MRAYLQEKICVENSSAELVFSSEHHSLEYILTDGRFGEFRGENVAEIFQESQVEYVFLESSSTVLLIGPSGQTIFRVNLRTGELETVGTVCRTDTWQEGFDYCEFELVETGGSALLYEMGIVRFDCSGKVVWQIQFSSAHVYPEFEGDAVVYHENEQECRYSLSSGSCLWP